MIKWLKRLFHLHTWETIDKRSVTLVWKNFGASKESCREGTCFYLRCKDCGNIKKVDLI